MRNHDGFTAASRRPAAQVTFLKPHAGSGHHRERAAYTPSNEGVDASIPYRPFCDYPARRGGLSILRSHNLQGAHPMRVFIVHAHPEPQSFNGAMTRNASAVLAAAGHEVVVSDLYRMGFDPVSSRRNFLTVLDPEYFRQ